MVESHIDVECDFCGGVVGWYQHRWWRVSLSRSRVGIIWDCAGRWVHVIGPLWLRTDGPVQYCDGCGSSDVGHKYSPDCAATPPPPADGKPGAK